LILLPSPLEATRYFTQIALLEALLMEDPIAWSMLVHEQGLI
jgi:hypothetical protein